MFCTNPELEVILLAQLEIVKQEFRSLEKRKADIVYQLNKIGHIWNNNLPPGSLGYADIDDFDYGSNMFGL